MNDNIVNFKQKPQKFTVLSSDNEEHMEILQEAMDIVMENGPLLDCIIDEDGQERFIVNEERGREIDTILHSWGYVSAHNDNKGVA
jgi:hypothetical protein